MTVSSAVLPFPTRNGRSAFTYRVQAVSGYWANTSLKCSYILFYGKVIQYHYQPMVNSTQRYRFYTLAIIGVLGLAGCGTYTSLHYTPTTECADVYCQMTSTTLSQSAELHAFIECQGYGTSLDSRGLTGSEASCYVTVLLTSPSPYNFDYSDYSLTFRDGDSHRVLWETEDLYLFENEHDDLFVKKLHVGFILSRWPKWLELILPPVEIDGSLHEIPVLRFERRTHKRFDHLLNWGG